MSAHRQTHLAPLAPFTPRSWHKAPHVPDLVARTLPDASAHAHSTGRNGEGWTEWCCRVMCMPRQPRFKSTNRLATCTGNMPGVQSCNWLAGWLVRSSTSLPGPGAWLLQALAYLGFQPRLSGKTNEGWL